MMHRAFFDDVSMSLFNIEKLLSQLFSNGIQPVSLAMRSVHKIVEEKLKTCSKCSIIHSVRSLYRVNLDVRSGFEDILHIAQFSLAHYR